MFHPAECYEQVDNEQRILVMSPLYDDNEDKIQEEYYKDVRKPSTLQSRPPSVASSLRDEPASAALRVRDTRSVCTQFTTAAREWTEGSRVSAWRAASPRHQRRDEEAGGRPQARVGPARAPRGLPHLRLHRHLATKGSAKAVDTRASVSLFVCTACIIYLFALLQSQSSDVSNTQDLLTSSFDISLCT